MTEDEKVVEVERIGDLIDNAIEGTEIGLAMVAFTEVIGSQLVMAAREMGKDRKFFEECADQLRDDLMMFWDYCASQKNKRLH